MTTTIQDLRLTITTAVELPLIFPRSAKVC